MTFKKHLLAAGILALSGAAMANTDHTAVLTQYADIAHAGYEDSVKTAEALREAVAKLVASPSESTLSAAKQAWVDARVPYQQTEVYRFGNAIVDDWEGKVNAWPLDEGLIDYVAADYGTESDENAAYTANVVANASLSIGGKAVDASQITPELLGETLHEIDGVEANVATGYHAIEFLLWGQDLNGTDAGAGNRPATDYDAQNCTGGNCERRAQYLQAATDLLIRDLQDMVSAWAPSGEARQAVMKDPNAGIQAILTGMGSLSYGELAGERMKLGVMLHDPEEEHDCFSDNTHNSHYYDALGIKNVYLGEYTRVNGDKLVGPGLQTLVKASAPEVDSKLSAELDSTMAAMGVLVESAEKGVAYDQLLAAGNETGNQKVLAAVNALVTQTRSIEKAAEALGVKQLQVEGSDSLDAPETVQ